MSDVIGAPERTTIEPDKREIEVSAPNRPSLKGAPPMGSPVTAARTREGLPPISWAFAAIAVAMLLWGAWVTKHIAANTAQAPIASVRLEAIVSEYLQAQSHGDGAPDAMTQATARFMAALDEELRKVGADGTTVLVGEAILSKNVPDITDQIRRAIYAKVPLPAAAPKSATVPMTGAVTPLPARGGVAPSSLGAPSGAPALNVRPSSLQGAGSGFGN